MTPNEYQQAALGTDGDDEFYMAANCRLGSHWAGFDKMRLLHASVGLCTEAGELQDALKKHIFYGREFDWTNAVEEVGDLLWYAALACESLGTMLEDAMERNIAKLKARYPEKFETRLAIERDLAAERAALEEFCDRLDAAEARIRSMGVAEALSTKQQRDNQEVWNSWRPTL